MTEVLCLKMDFQEVGGGCEEWMELAQDRDRWRALLCVTALTQEVEGTVNVTPRRKVKTYNE